MPNPFTTIETWMGKLVAALNSLNGTIGDAINSQTGDAHQFLATPATSAGSTALRTIVTSDLEYITLPIANGGTGATTAVNALTNLGALANPMTAASDLIVGGSAGAPTRFPKGSPGQALITNASDVLGWGVPTLTSGLVTPTGAGADDTLANWLKPFVPVAGSNNVTQETLAGVTEGTGMGLYAGTSASPDNVDTQPILWLQRHTIKSQSAATSQTVGGYFSDVEVHGSGTSTSPTLGAWIGGMSSVNGLGTNVGTSTAPAYDTVGDVVGFAGFAANNGVPGDGHIITGLWGWAKGPTIDATTYGNLPSQNWTICGMEVNVTVHSPDVGVQTGLIGNGSSVGYLATNYRPVGAGVLDWTFGMVFAGTPNDGNYNSTNLADWNGFHTCILIDKIKDFGIQIGYYVSANAYGIGFQSNYAGMSTRLKAGIYMGDTQLNWGEFYGATTNLGDEWANGGQRYYHGNNGNETLFGSLGVGTATGNTVDHKVHINIDGTDYYLLASTSNA